MDSLEKFVTEYMGALIGVAVAILILATRMYILIIWILVIIAGAFLGNYVQRNREEVKTKLRNLIDKM